MAKSSPYFQTVVGLDLTKPYQRCIDFCWYLFTYLFLFYNSVVTETAKQTLARKTAHNKLTMQTVVSLWL